MVNTRTKAGQLRQFRGFDTVAPRAAEVSILRSSVQFASVDESVDLRTTAAAGEDNPLLRKALRRRERDLNRSAVYGRAMRSAVHRPDRFSCLRCSK